MINNSNLQSDMDNKWLTIETDGQNVVLKKCSKEANGEIIVPDGVTLINVYAFISCSGITSIKLPNSLKKIFSGAFARCSGLSSIVIPASVEIITSGAFRDCKNLTSINIPDRTRIKNGAFSGCDGIKEIILPKRIVALRGLSNRRLDYIFEGVDLSHCTLIASHEVKKELLLYYVGDYNIKYV